MLIIHILWGNIPVCDVYMNLILSVVLFLFFLFVFFAFVFVFQEPKMKWMLYNLGGLYWQISGNNYHGIECLRRALYHTPIEYADIPLVNAASIMLRLKRPQDAIQLLRMALVVNSTEVNIVKY